MQILVTGGAGYIGAQTCKELSKVGFEPICIDNLSTGNVSSVKWGPLELGDIRDSDFMDFVFQKYQISAVMHFAGSAYVEESIKNPTFYYSNNIHATCNLLDTMIKNKVRKIVFSSSCATYGESDKSKICETTKQNPVNTYGFTKLACEKLIINLSNNQLIDYAILRYFNAAGADLEYEIGELHEPESHIIPLAIKAATEGRTFQVYGRDFETQDGTAVRDYVHVKDLARAHILALQKIIDLRDSFEVNLGSGIGTSNLEIVNQIKKMYPTFSFEFKERRLGDPAFLVADISNASRILGWKPLFSSMETILETANIWESTKRKHRIIGTNENLGKQL